MSLAPGANEDTAVELLKCADPEARIELAHNHTSYTLAHISLPRLNRRITLVQPPKTATVARVLTGGSAGGECDGETHSTDTTPHLMTTLDLAKVAHVILFLHGARDSAASPISEDAHTLISALFSQGFSSNCFYTVLMEWGWHGVCFIIPTEILFIRQEFRPVSTRSAACAADSHTTTRSGFEV